MSEITGRIASQDFKIIIQDLNSRDEIRKLKALIALGNLGDVRGLPALCQITRSGSVYERIAAIKSLGKMHYPDSINALTAALQDEAEDVRVQAAIQLGILNHQSSIPHLVEAMKGGTWNVCIAASEAMVKMGERTIDFMVPLLSHENVVIHHHVISYLGKIPCQRSVLVLFQLHQERDKDIQQRSIESLARLRDISHPIILAYLNHEDQSIRIHAAQILGKIGRRDDILQLQQKIETEKDQQVKKEMKRTIKILNKIK